MKTPISRHNDWHIKCCNDLWKVYDRDQKYRCSFRTRAEAETYIEQHRTRRPSRQSEPRPAVVALHAAQMMLLSE